MLELQAQAQVNTDATSNTPPVYRDAGLNFIISPEDKRQNRALFDKSMKPLTLIVGRHLVILKIGGNLYLTYVRCSGHF